MENRTKTKLIYPKGKNHMIGGFKKNNRLIPMLFSLLVLFGSGSVLAQETEHLSFGIGYSYSYLKMTKNIIREQLTYNGKRDNIYEWTQEELNDFNKTGFDYINNDISVSLFSGLSGSKASKIRFGFGLLISVDKFIENTYFEKEVFMIRQNSSVNIRLDASAYMEYNITDKWKIFNKTQVSYLMCDINSVKNYDEFYNDNQFFQINYNNELRLSVFHSLFMADFSYKHFHFQLGSQIVSALSNAESYEILNDNTSSDIIESYDYYQGENSYMIRAAVGFSYNIDKHLNPYLLFAAGKDFQFILGIQF